MLPTTIPTLAANQSPSPRQSRILIVDDIPDVLYTLERLLARENYQVRLAYSGVQALQMVAEEPPDTILLDAMMPLMNGYEVCRELKGNPVSAHIPIIMVTSLDREDALGRGIDAGADDFLSKPVNGNELRARVRSMLRIKHSYDELQNSLQAQQDLADIILHDIKNPLSAIMLSSETWLHNQNKSISPEKTIRRIYVQAQRILQYTNNLLTLAKLDHDRLPVRLVPSNLTELVQGAINRQRQAADSRAIDIQLSEPQESLIARVDRNLIDLMVDNLLAHALQSTARSGTVRVRVCPYDGDPSNRGPQGICIQIQDEGHSIPQASQEMVFDRRSVVDAYRTGKPHYGLSLPLCATITRAHGGTIELAPLRPQGSVFTVHL